MENTCKIIAWLAAFCICGSACLTASAEEKRTCMGDLQTTGRSALVTPVSSGPYDFLVVSRVDSKSDFNVAVLCVQNNTAGALYFNFPVADVQGWIPAGELYESQRPYMKDAPLTIAVGCFFYGNLAVRSEASFYADYQTIFQAEREKQGGCAKPKVLSQ